MKKEKVITGKEYWRSLDQLADTPEFREFLEREFPENASEMNNPLTRRKFLTLMGASIALAGLNSCRKPVEKIVPYVKAPESVIPGVSKYYATTMPFGLSAYGLLVESHEGRPTKIEGNEKHPSTLGKSNIFTQAAILGLYDPDRSHRVLYENQGRDWIDFIGFWRDKYVALSENKGQGFAVLSESFNSPTLYRLYGEFKQKFPMAKWFAYEPVSDENIYRGIELATGKVYQPLYDYAQARVICSLESDFLLTESENITANKGFALGRQVLSETDSMNRLYMVENNLSLTGGMADHRLRMPSSQILPFSLALGHELNEQGLLLNFPLKDIKADLETIDQRWVKALAKDLMQNQTQSLVLAGRRQPAIVHALVFSLNEALGNSGKSVHYREMNEAVLPSRQSIAELSQAMQNGGVNTLFILGANPVYNTPVDLNFRQLLNQVESVIHLSTHVDETSRQAHWHLPMAHFLESWGDAKSQDGTRSIIQPLIEPLYKGRSLAEVMELMVTGKELSGYEIVRSTWTAILEDSAFESAWRVTLHDGLLEEKNRSLVKPKSRMMQTDELLKEYPLQPNKAGPDNLEIVFQVSPAVFDGRFANNGWLQEMPDPVSKLSWDNALFVSPKTAKELALKNEDMVQISYEGRSIEMPVWILPGKADYSITVNLGYGREAAGRIGNFVGFNAYRLRTGTQPDFAIGAKLTKTNATYPLANSQDHGSMESRPLVREATVEEYQKHPTFARDMVKHPPLKSLWDEHSYAEGYQWGMTIDLNACSGCMACVIACQSENNIPIVGKEQVSKGREMHWIRLDRYFAGALSDPEMVHQPVGCLHCENAPCEQVCPVAATVHDAEGLNVMTYNRCIGTRYCSNNCPYKVRRFNFFNYTKDYPEMIKMVQNPDVTVRSRGVMEKCTYCTQRINEAKIRAKNEGRILEDGEVVTACQQSCPADAIVFGNINDLQSMVSKMKKTNRDYTMLAELNVKTRTTYLAKLRNPNPELS